MSALDDACREVVERVDNATACGLIDLDTGVLLGLHAAPAQDLALSDAVARATVEIFCGPAITHIEELVRAQCGIAENGEHYVREVYVGSEQLAYFARTVKDGRTVLMLVTKTSVNIGMGWAQLRGAIPALEELLP